MPKADVGGLVASFILGPKRASKRPRSRLARRVSRRSSPQPIVRNGKNCPLIAIDSSGLPLGITADAEYLGASTPFGPGAMLFLYSDVFIDFLHEHGQPFDKVGALALAQSCADASTAEAFVERICAPLLAPLSRALGDDLTAVCVLRP